jgi:glycosyltransferase involved in cell wall biosynthesis
MGFELWNFCFNSSLLLKGTVMKLSVIMPVHNEVETIDEIIEHVLNIPEVYELIIVDDGSGDGTIEAVENISSDKIKIIRHETNKGKGAAVRTGFKVASGDLVVIQDADLEYDPKDYSRLIKPIEDGETDVVYGVRSLETQRIIMRLGNHFVTWVTNIIHGQKLKDMETCYKVMKREIAQKLELECRGFDIEAEITSKILQQGHTIYQLPISYTARYDNKKLSPLDGIPTIKALLKYRNWKPSV